jgi:peptidoglycan/LPS O-acetylase OafA/YrhL
MGAHDTGRAAVREPLQGEIRPLTGLRAVAATWVVLFHLQNYARPYIDPIPLLRSFVAAGWTGVDLFFILSGFVISLRYVDSMGRRPGVRSAGRFWLNRFARVWPAWATVVLLMGGWLGLLRFAGWDSEVVTGHPAVEPMPLLRQLTMTQMWGRDDFGGASYVLPGWSISAEWLAYLAFPLLAVFLRPLRRLPAGVLLAGAVAVMSPLAITAFAQGPLDHQLSWLARISLGFVAGSLVALALRRLDPASRLREFAPRLTWIALALLVLGTTWASWRRGGDGAHQYAGIVVVLYPLLVAGLALSERGPARWLGSPAMVYGGRISYCVYLVHYAILDAVFTVWWQDPVGRKTLTPGFVLTLPLLIAVFFLAAAALHHGVEEPARRLVQGLPDRFARRRAPHPARAVHDRAGVGVGPLTPVTVRRSDSTERVAPVDETMPPRSAPLLPPRRAGVPAPVSGSR